MPDEKKFAAEQQEITPAMIEAGKEVLYREYAGTFDARENDPVALVELVYGAMENARR